MGPWTKSPLIVWDVWYRVDGPRKSEWAPLGALLLISKCPQVGYAQWPSIEALDPGTTLLQAALWAPRITMTPTGMAIKGFPTLSLTEAHTLAYWIAANPRPLNPEVVLKSPRE